MDLGKQPGVAASWQNSSYRFLPEPKALNLGRRSIVMALICLWARMMCCAARDAVDAPAKPQRSLCAVRVECGGYSAASALAITA
ncbi:MAG: hypothetical protein R3D05_09895 [Dongiaceae bacterium]